MRKPKWFYCEYWRFWFCFCIQMHPTTFKKFMSSYFQYDTETDGCAGLTLDMYKSETNEQAIVIWTRSKSDEATLAHECLHAANWCLDNRGWKPDARNDEPLTYMMTLLIRKANEK